MVGEARGKNVQEKRRWEELSHRADHGIREAS